MGVFVAEVQPRWSDMDSFGHVNNAKIVTLLEEARVSMLFMEAARHGADMSVGMVVAKLAVDYQAQLTFTGDPIRVDIAVTEMRAASFTLAYTVYAGRDTDGGVAVRAETVMAPFDLQANRPRRLSTAERDFLATWRVAEVRAT